MITIDFHTLSACIAEAIRSYPSEGCGFLLGPQMGVADQFIAVTNRQDELHAEDPVRFPRTSATAYSIDPKSQQTIFIAAKAERRAVTAIFHSHPDHDAYFSAEDKTNAAPWGEPLLPGLAYLVVSVYNGKLKEVKQFFWNPDTSDFDEALVTTTTDNP